MKTCYQLCFCILILFSFHLSAQPPQAIPYQAVARDNSGNVIASQNISVRFSIRDSIATGTLVYSETQYAATNSLGLFTVDIGRGTVASGVFKNIKWGNNAKFLQVELDTAGGSSYTDMGTSEMLSVPYALFADSSNFAGVIYDTSLMVINTSTHDTVFLVDKTGKSKHKGKESFYGGVWIYNESLVVVNESGEIVFIVFPDGTSHHKGLETFEGGIQVKNATGEVTFNVAPDGTSRHAGLESFAGGIDVLSGSAIRLRDPQGNLRVVINADDLILTDASGNPTFAVNSSTGISFHKGQEFFNGGLVVSNSAISVEDANGNEVFKVNPDGTSMHNGLETFNAGIVVANSNLNVTGTGVISGNGSGITGLNASNVNNGILGNAFTSGTSSNVPNTLILRDGSGNFSGGTMTGTFAGNGTGLSLSSNVALKNTANVFSQPQTININSGTPAFQCMNALGPAAVFNGNVQVNGNLSKASGSFKIDHPLDPTNKYLYHSFVESPDMMNIYNRNVTLDVDGKATIELPDWFGALNKDFRYQLTPIGASGPDLYVAEEVSNNLFKIAGGKPGMKVSWQVTGVRHDAYANDHRVVVEEEKTAEARGTYLYPEAINK